MGIRDDRPPYDHCFIWKLRVHQTHDENQKEGYGTEAATGDLEITSTKKVRGSLFFFKGYTYVKICIE